MKALARIAAALAAFGISPGDTNLLARMGINRRTVSKHAFNRTLRNARQGRRYTIARGPGSISAKADIQQLCDANRYDEAREMAEAHERMCGEKLFPSAWWRTSISQG